MSRYPERIDSSVDLPLVRNNITEATAEVINKIRQAVINIERAVGTNPMGSAADLTDRIGVSLNDDGTIKSSAISSLNIIQGPISNADVSQNAKIKESKLDLDYSTYYLKSSILAIDTEVQNAINAINEVISKLSLHISSASAHNASQINITNGVSSPALTSSKTIVDEDVKSAIERIYDEHINISPTLLTQSSNAHSASQIFYSNEAIESQNVSSVMGALDFILGMEQETLTVSYADITENSVISIGNLKDKTEEFQKETLASSIPVYYNSTIGDSLEISFVSDRVIKNLEVGDYIYLKSGNIEDFERLTITKINYSIPSSETVTSLRVKNTILVDDDGTSVASITKNGRSSYNKNSLNTSFRVYSGSSSNSSVYIENPDSASVISYNFLPPTSSQRKLKITHEGGSEEIDVFNQNFQSLEYVIHALNTYFCDNNISLSASKIIINGKGELCISHILPNSSAFSKKPFVMIEVASSDDFSTLAGFYSLIGIKNYGKNENTSIINGSILNNLFYPTEISSFISISSGETSVDSTTNSVQALRVRKRDLLFIEHDGNPVGIYDVKDISGSTISFVTSDPFSFDKNQSTKVFLIKNTVSIEEISSLSSQESSLCDIGIDEVGNIIISERINVTGSPISGTSFVSQIRISDVSSVGMESGNFELKYSSTKRLYIKNLSSGLTGSAIYAPVSGFYKVETPSKDGYVTVEVITDKSPLTSEVILKLSCKKNISMGVFLLSRVLFSKDLSYFSTPSSYGNIYVSSASDKRNFGPIGVEQVSSNFISRIINLPTSELNSNIVYQGFNLTGSLSVDGGEVVSSMEIGDGIAYINGKRIYFPSRSLEYRTSTLQNAFIIANSRGEIAIREVAGKLDSSIGEDYIILYSNFASGDYYSVSSPPHLFSRSFKLGGKLQDVITDVVVGIGGHFETIVEAIRYFDAVHETRELKDSCRITLKNQTHVVTETLRLGQYSLEVIGSGSDCKMVISDEMSQSFSNGDGLYGINAKIPMLKITHFNGYSNANSIIFRNIIFDYTSISIGGSYCVLMIDRKSGLVNVTDKKITKFENCSFLGSDSLTNSHVFYNPASSDPINESGVFYLVPFVVAPALEFDGSTSYVGNLYVSGCFFQKTGSILAGGPVVFVAYSSTVTDTSKLPVDQIILRENVYENCNTPTDLIPFYGGSNAYTLDTSNPISMSKNFASLSSNNYILF
jgi:hypothetical protein